MTKQNDPQSPAPEWKVTAPDDGKHRRRWRRRLRVFQIGLLLFFMAVCLRLVQIQIIQSERFVVAAEGQYRKTKDRPARRGSILDRDSVAIATSSIYVSIQADPVNVGGAAPAVAKSLSQITGKPRKYYLNLLKLRKNADGKYDHWVELEPSVEQGPVYARRMDTLKGLTFEGVSKRIYHTGDIAGQLLGMTNVADSGIAGIERGFDSLLTGTDGYTVYQKDGAGGFGPSVEYPSVEPVAGNTLMLTIDLRMQEIAESELEKGVKLNHAEGGVVVMLRPKTGELLAVAQYPRVNPAAFKDASQENQKLRAVTDMLEPGSVFKIVTAAAAIDNGLISPDRVFDASNGVYQVFYKGQKTPRIIRDVHKYASLSFRQAIENSSNIVMAKASDIIGNELLYRMARDFGIGMKTGVDIPAEAGGSLKNPVDWSAPTRNTLAYGYEVAVTPIQLAVAYATVANGGVMMRPFIMKKEIAPDGSVVRETEPAPVRRVVSVETAATLTSFFEGVVERGTATTAKIPGTRIAGKTGTSRRFVNGKYAEKEYTASFVGYFPADDPQVVCLVMLDNPNGISYYGGTTSAPIFREIISRVIASSPEFAAPAAPIAEAARPDSETPANRVPAGKNAAAPARKQIAQERNAGGKNVTADVPRHIVPDVVGYSKRKAISLLRDEEFQPVVNGDGVVVSQDPRPGEPVSSSRVITLTCQPRSVNQGGIR
jgi:cell division protein FtsI (penicillin-binding protein 3)